MRSNMRYRSPCADSRIFTNKIGTCMDWKKKPEVAVEAKIACSTVKNSKSKLLKPGFCGVMTDSTFTVDKVAQKKVDAQKKNLSNLKTNLEKKLVIDKKPIRYNSPIGSSALFNKSFQPRYRSPITNLTVPSSMNSSLLSGDKSMRTTYKSCDSPNLLYMSLTPKQKKLPKNTGFKRLNTTITSITAVSPKAKLTSTRSIEPSISYRDTKTVKPSFGAKLAKKGFKSDKYIQTAGSRHPSPNIKTLAVSPPKSSQKSKIISQSLIAHDSTPINRESGGFDPLASFEQILNQTKRESYFDMNPIEKVFSSNRVIPTDKRFMKSACRTFESLPIEERFEEEQEESKAISVHSPGFYDKKSPKLAVIDELKRSINSVGYVSLKEFDDILAKYLNTENQATSTCSKGESTFQTSVSPQCKKSDKNKTHYISDLLDFDVQVDTKHKNHDLPSHQPDILTQRSMSTPKLYDHQQSIPLDHYMRLINDINSANNKHEPSHTQIAKHGSFVRRSSMPPLTHRAQDGSRQSDGHTSTSSHRSERRLRCYR